VASVFRRFSGLIPSSLSGFGGTPLVGISGRLSEDWDRLRAFCAAPSMPSRLKLAVRCVFSADGDLSGCWPLVVGMPGTGISILKVSLDGTPGKGLAIVAVAEPGESPVDDGDMVLSQ